MYLTRPQCASKPLTYNERVARLFFLCFQKRHSPDHIASRVNAFVVCCGGLRQLRSSGGCLKVW